MSMTKSDFENVVNVISTLDISPNDLRHVGTRFADELANLYPNFDREKFLDRLTVLLLQRSVRRNAQDVKYKAGNLYIPPAAIT